MVKIGLFLVSDRPLKANLDRVLNLGGPRGVPVYVSRRDLWGLKSDRFLGALRFVLRDLLYMICLTRSPGWFTLFV